MARKKKNSHKKRAPARVSHSRVKLYNESKKQYFTSVRAEHTAAKSKTAKRGGSEKEIEKFYDKEVAAKFRTFFNHHTKSAKKKSRRFSISIKYNFGPNKPSGYGVEREEIRSVEQMENYLAYLKQEFMKAMSGYLNEKGRSRVHLTGAQFEAVKPQRKKWKGFDWKKQKSKLIKEGMKKSKKYQARIANAKKKKAKVADAMKWYQQKLKKEKLSRVQTKKAKRRAKK